MSHPDRTHHHTIGPAAQDLREVFRWLLHKTDVPKLPLRSDCGFSPRGLVVTILLWVFSDEGTLTHGFHAAREAARTFLRGGVPQVISYQAFTRLLVRWSDPLLVLLKAASRQRMLTSLKAHFHVAGYCLLGVDGSRLDLPRTVANARPFAPSAAATGGSRRRSRKSATQSRTSRRKKGDRPQLWLTTLWHAGTGLVWDWRIGPADSSERGHLKSMLDQVPENVLLTADAGFVGYETWKTVLDAGGQFVIRVGGNVRLLKELGYCRESNNTVSLWPDRESRRHQPPLVLRLVVVHDGRQDWYLVTSIRNPRTLSDRQVAEVYRRRWGVEVCFRHFKQTFARRKLRSRTPAHVRCEAHWNVLGLNVLRLYALVVLHRGHIPPDRLSVASALRAFRQTMRWSLTPLRMGPALNDRLAECLIDEYVRESKSNRSYPQKKYKPGPRPPVIKQATKEQREQAQRTMKTRRGLTA